MLNLSHSRKAMTTNLDKKLTVYPAQSRDLGKLLTIGRKKRSQIFYVDTYHSTVLRSKKTLTAKLLWGYLTHDTEMSPSTSKALAQLCLPSLCSTKWILLLVSMTDSNLPVPWVWFVQLNENKNVFCTTLDDTRLGCFSFKKNNSIASSKHVRDRNHSQTIILHFDQCNFANSLCQQFSFKLVLGEIIRTKPENNDHSLCS